MSYCLFAFLLPVLLAIPLAAADLRIGIIGTDISHVIHFSRILNNDSDPEHVPGARIVAAYKGGSPGIVSSRTRVDNYARELAKTWGIEMVLDILMFCSKVDAVIIERGDGRITL